MRSPIRKKLEMAAAVRQFGRDNPTDDAGYAVMLGGLEDMVARTEVLAAQEMAGRVTELAAIGRRNELRHNIHFNLGRHLIRTAELAAKDHPELLGKFRTPAIKSPNSTYLIEVKKLLAEGRAHQEVLLSYGLSAPMFAQLEATTALFEAAINDRRTGRTGHIGARAELEALGTEILKRVAQLDTFNRERFKQDPEHLAGWVSVATVLGLPRLAPPTSGDEPTTPPSAAEPAA